jgi:probable O-glycosylation ligase (exosortase A-associated)
MRIVTLLFIYYSCIFYALFNPIFGILFFIHITIFRPESLVWDNLVFGRLHFITSLSVLAGYLTKRKFNEGVFTGNHQTGNIRLFLTLVLWLIVVSLLAERSVQFSFNKTIEIAKIFVLCFLFTRLIHTKNQIEAYVWVTSISFAMLSFWGVMQGLAGNYRLDTLWPGGSNYIAAQLVLMAPFTFAKVFDLTLSTKYRMLFFACALWIVLCCIYTDSRGGFLGLGVGMFIFALQIRQHLKVLAGLVMLGILVAPLIPAHYTDRITSMFAEREELDESAASRPVLWQIALRIWQDHPIAGVGLENFSPVKETYADRVNDIVTSEEMFQLIFNRQRYTHGLYPGMMAETGIIGTGLFLLLLLRNAFCRFPSSPGRAEDQSNMYLQIKGAQAGLIGFSVSAVFGDFQYIEMLYLQLFFVGIVHSYADQLVKMNEHLGDIRPLVFVADKKAIASS